jgi:excisionase family DNA binding protein
MNENQASPWMTPVVTAAYLGIALGTLRNWTSAQYIPHAKRGRVVRYHRDAVDRWLARGACPGRSIFANSAN